MPDLGAGVDGGSFAHGSYPVAARPAGLVPAAGPRAAGVVGGIGLSASPQLSSTVAALRAGSDAVDGVRASFGATSTIPPSSAGGLERVVSAAVGAGRGGAGRVVAGSEVSGQSSARRDVDGRDVVVGFDVSGQSVVGRGLTGRAAVAGAGFGGGLAAALARAARASGLLGSNRGGSVPFLT